MESLKSLPEVITSLELATALRLSDETPKLWRWARKNKINYINHGPPFVRISGSIRYERDAVIAWLEEQQS